MSDRELAALIQRAEEGGISRRQLLKLFASGGVGAVLAACERAPGPDAATVSVELPWVKDPAPFFQHPTNLETRLELLDGVITPNELFFVRNHAPTPRLDGSQYVLRVTGDAVEREIELTLADLGTLPSESVVAYLECAGNWRSFWLTETGRNASGGQWARGGVGCAEWSGPTLASVLALAGVRDTAVDVDVIGLDDGAFSRAMPIDRALDPTTLVALRMNGEPLPADHGYPVDRLDSPRDLTRSSDSPIHRRGPYPVWSGAWTAAAPGEKRASSIPCSRTHGSASRSTGRPCRVSIHS